VSDFLDQKLQEIDARLQELRPLVDEYQRLEAARSALDQAGVGATAAPAGRRRGRQPRAARAARSTQTAGKKRTGRRRGSGLRSQQTLQLVSASPQGISIPELAQKMGIRQNYLYRVMPALHKEGKVRKRGRLWYPTELAASASES